MVGERLTHRALNRALLARQGLLSRWELPVVDVVESIGALQGQYWPALPVALWTRMRDFRTEDLYRALEERRLVVGTLIRGTLHLVSAGEHPSYAAVVEASGNADWRRTAGAAPPEMEVLRSELLMYAQSVPRSVEDLVGFIESWIAEHPTGLDEAELALQRSFKWRPFRSWVAFVRAPADGRWGPRAPAAQMAAPCLPPAWPGPEEGLAAVVRCHLRAFGPAAAEDVAGWIGWRTPAVREALGRFGSEVVRFEDEAGRVLYDLPGAPRPDPDVPAPVRLLPWFDSVLLAYAPRHRARILPDAYRDRVYVRANLQWLPTFLVDGLVAGTWSIEAQRRKATLSLRPFSWLERPVRDLLLEEAERLLRFSHPAAVAHQVVVDE